MASVRFGQDHRQRIAFAEGGYVKNNCRGFPFHFAEPATLLNTLANFRRTASLHTTLPLAQTDRISNRAGRQER